MRVLVPISMAWLLAVPSADAAPKTKPVAHGAAPVLAVTPKTIVAENMEAAAKIYEAAELEQMKLFEVVDVIATRFLAGKLPLGKGSAKRIHRWVDSKEDRLDADARRRMYGHVLGTSTPGRVQVNRDFAPLLARFVETVGKHERQRALDTGKATDVDAERVREAARDLALNLSNRTYGAPVASAKSLAKMSALANGIVGDPAVQEAFGAASDLDLVVKVADEHLDAKVDAALHRENASAGVAVLRAVVKLAAPLASKGGAAAQELSPAERRVGASVRTLDRNVVAKHPPRAISKVAQKVVALCYDDDDELVPCKTIAK